MLRGPGSGGQRAREPRHERTSGERGRHRTALWGPLARSLLGRVTEVMRAAPEVAVGESRERSGVAPSRGSGIALLRLRTAACGEESGFFVAPVGRGGGGVGLGPVCDVRGYWGNITRQWLVAGLGSSEVIFMARHRLGRSRWVFLVAGETEGSIMRNGAVWWSERSGGQSGRGCCSRIFSGT